ncbi:MAG: sigma factor-like helix-turn-helix DNA-binding protein [Planctomycetota bacterium]
MPMATSSIPSPANSRTFVAKLLSCSWHRITHAEAAVVVGVSVKTVQRRLNRARLLLAEQLADLRPGGTSESPADAATS